MNEILICLGSNHDPERNIAYALSELCSYYSLVRVLPAVYTEPVGAGLGGTPFFLNQVLLARTDDMADEVRSRLKAMERSLGRCPEQDKSGCIPLDADLLKWNDTILKPDDLCRDYIVEAIALLGL